MIKAMKHTQKTLKTLKTHTADAANVCHRDFLIEETELSNRLMPYLAATDRNIMLAKFGNSSY